MPPTETERGSRGSLNPSFQVAGSPRQFGTGRHRGTEGVGGGIEEGQDSGGSSSSGESGCHEREVPRTRQEAVGSRRHRTSSDSQEEVAMRARDCRGRSRFSQDAGGTFCVRRGTEDRSAAVAGESCSVGGDPGSSRPRFRISCGAHSHEGCEKASVWLCRRCFAVHRAGSGLLVGRQADRTPGCVGNGRQGVRQRHHKPHHPGARQDGELRSTTVRTLEHGALRRVTGWGYRGIRVGEAFHPGPHRLASSSEDEFLVHEELLDGLQRDLLPGSRRRVRRRMTVRMPSFGTAKVLKCRVNQPNHEPDAWYWFHPRKWTLCSQQCLTVSFVPLVEGGESAVKVQILDLQQWWEVPSTMI